MNIGQTLLGRQAPALIAQLMRMGFSANKAQSLLSEAVQQLMTVMSNQEGDQAGSELLDSIDVPAVAAKLNMENDLVGNALKSILPTLTSALRDSRVSGLSMQREAAGLLDAGMSMLGRAMCGR